MKQPLRVGLPASSDRAVSPNMLVRTRYLPIRMLLVEAPVLPTRSPEIASLAFVATDLQSSLDELAGFIAFPYPEPIE